MIYPVDAVEGFKETRRWSINFRKRVVALTIKGPKHVNNKAASSDPVIPGDPLWNWNTPL